MRHSDSSPPIPPRFVAFARRYHPSTCGSLRRTPGATSTASGLVSRCPPPGGLYDGDDEASRVPGKPTRTHATRSDPGEVAASTASETRRDDLPSNARRRPSHSVHFGAQSRGLRAPCERFAPWVTPGPRITRFRLAADLGRMGLDTHRVSNKVSKITSRHLVPLDRAFPAHALVHESSLARTMPTGQDPHLPMQYDAGWPRAVIRLRIAQPRTTSLPCPAGSWRGGRQGDQWPTGSRRLRAALPHAPTTDSLSTPGGRPPGRTGTRRFRRHSTNRHSSSLWLKDLF